MTQRKTGYWYERSKEQDSPGDTLPGDTLYYSAILYFVSLCMTPYHSISLCDTLCYSAVKRVLPPFNPIYH